MLEIRNVIIYAAWLQENGRKNPEGILDCLHVAVGENKTEKEIKEYVLRRVKETPQSFSIGIVPIEKIDITIIRLATIEKGAVDIEVMG